MAPALFIDFCCKPLPVFQGGMSSQSVVYYN